MQVQRRLRVGIKPDGGQLKVDGFETINVLMKSHSKWGALGPYHLKTEKGEIFENVWQFSKIYEVVPKSRQVYSRWDSTVIWNWPEERHMRVVPEDTVSENQIVTYDGVTYEILPEYWHWRSVGFQHQYHCRYPVGFRNRHLVKFSILGGATEDGCTPLETMDYITSRKKIYLPLYCELVRKEPLFWELKKKVDNGEVLCICEVDGPHQESLSYYKSKYGVGDDFITQNSMEVTKENIEIMLNDGKHPFGHGYCLALALLDMDKEFI